MRSCISPNWRERTTAVPDSPGCTDEGNVDQSVMLEGRLVSFTGFSFVSGSCYFRRTITRDQSLKTGQCSSVMAPSAPKVPSFSFRSNLVILGGRPAYLSNDVGHPASGLAFGHSVCNKESSASSRTSFTTCHQDGQKLAGYVGKGLLIRHDHCPRNEI